MPGPAAAGRAGRAEGRAEGPGRGGDAVGVAWQGRANPGAGAGAGGRRAKPAGAQARARGDAKGRTGQADQRRRRLGPEDRRPEREPGRAKAAPAAQRHGLGRGIDAAGRVR